MWCKAFNEIMNRYIQNQFSLLQDSSLYHAIMKKHTEIFNPLTSYGGDVHIRDRVSILLL